MERWRIDICPTVTTDGLFLVSGIALNRIGADRLYKIRKTFTSVGLKRIDKLKKFFIEWKGSKGGVHFDPYIVAHFNRVHMSNQKYSRDNKITVN